MDGSTKDFIPLRQSNKRKSYTTKQHYDINSVINSDHVRSLYGIDVDGNNVPTPFNTFEEMDLPVQYMSYLRKKNVMKPTPIQMQAISCLVNERDIIGISSTGSGKTFAYILPLLSVLKKLATVGCNDISSVSPLGLILVPSRELMSQVYEILCDMLYVDKMTTKTGHFFSQNNIGSNINEQYNSSCPNIGIASNSVVGVCGGVPLANDLSRLNCQTKVIVATPGRLIDLYERNKISLSHIKYFVIDECDKLLDLGLEEQLRKIVAMVTVHGQSLQTSLWSATLPSSLERLARSAVVDPIYICTGIKDVIGSNVKQNIIFLHSYMKHKKLLEIIRQVPYPPIIIFVQSKHKADEVTGLLCREQFHAAAIHSGKIQSFRNEVMASFRNSEIDVLVSTDLISRGMDIPTVTHVINFDTPDTIEDYLHRCGRTGRLGRMGDTTTFLTLRCKIAYELKEMLVSTNNDIPAELLDTSNFGKDVIETELGDRIKK